ncbi:MAG TPA: HAMP domain-containing sensor histidine kinase [Terriglobales bacterium]|nr:HAMP domain-containing sensor histidine kinase [Terriglobales bacterium]
MTRTRIRTKLLIVMLFVFCVFCCVSLLLIHYSVQRQARENLKTDLQGSVAAFENAQHLRNIALARTAALLANLPSLKALMTTRDAPTIKDAAADFWRLSATDLFLLADREGKVVALHAQGVDLNPATAQELLHSSLNAGATSDWWFGAEHLYEVAWQPIYFGPEREQNELGVVLVGYEVNDRTAAEVEHVAGAQVAFSFGKQIVTDTLQKSQAGELASLDPSTLPATGELTLAGERFLFTALRPSASRPLQLTILESFDRATGFLGRLDRLLVILAVITVLLGAGLLWLIANTVTRPLGGLVAGVRALQGGDFSYPLVEKGGHEVAELTAAFRAMRETLQSAQRELLHAERMATIGQMASSLSHDMRHQLSAIFANAEFLCNTRLTDREREELFSEIRVAVNDMTDLVDSMLEFSRAPQAGHGAPTNLVPILEHAVQAVKAHPEYRNREIKIYSMDAHEGFFDARRLQRAFYNLFLNAAEAVAGRAEGEEQIQVLVMQDTNSITARIIDNGPGVPAEIRAQIFDPFVSFGKERGSGMGLTIARKIVQDHGGDVVMEAGDEGRTIFAVSLPVGSAPMAESHPKTEPSTPTTQPDA